MPSQTPAAVGVKVVTVTPENPIRGLPRIQAACLIFDPETLALRAVLDGTALTTLRTPAVSVTAVPGRLPDRPLRVAAIGVGPQATGMSPHRPPFVRSTPSHTWSAIPPAHASTPLGSDRAQADEALGSADVVVCAASAGLRLRPAARPRRRDRRRLARARRPRTRRTDARPRHRPGPGRRPGLTISTCFADTWYARSSG